jgi:hypothetical protein
MSIKEELSNEEKFEYQLEHFFLYAFVAVVVGTIYFVVNRILSSSRDARDTARKASFKGR